MILRNIDFGHVWDASGVRGFFGEGYWYHTLLRATLGFSFKGVTFVAKTTTVWPRPGNMELTPTNHPEPWVPLRLFPDCIAINWGKAAAVNSVGLSGPGSDALFKDGRWNEVNKPFFLSFMGVGDEASERQRQFTYFTDQFNSARHKFQAPVGLQLNFSCPNTGHDPAKLIEDIEWYLTYCHNHMRHVPIVVKLNALTPIAVAMEIERHSVCDAICVSNTIPWGKHSDIDWKSLFGSEESPLPKKYGGGGLSGSPILPIVADWIRRARAAGFTKPINGGGGIMCPADVRIMKAAGANSVFLGTIVMLRPWAYRATVKEAHRVFGGNT